MTTAVNEPIAILGAGCRFPGGINDLHTLWAALCARTTAFGEIPSNRWSLPRFYSSNKGAQGKMYVRNGGFLHQPLDEMDASFFGISPREAESLDPQQRLLLEVSWEAMENAGLDVRALAGSKTGVFVGGFTLDHMLNQMGAASRDHISSHTAVGSTMTMLSNRISHSFDFRGPSISMDTACSSSLVALHQACQALWTAQCTMALAGGVNVILRPEMLIAMCKGGFLAEDGLCKSFDTRADGYARGEGAGIVVLKRLRDAIHDNDPILALVHATGVNQDGRTNGITVPNGAAQEALMREVCSAARIEPQKVAYVEAHGTGTALGDPTEAAAIGAVYGKSRADGDAPCIIGSVKSNIGHLEAASGIAGIIKSVLCLMHNRVPPLATLVTPNPNIPFADLGLRLADALLPLTADSDPSFIGVNSFGYGGTNAHVLLGGALDSDNAVAKHSDDNIELFARSEPHILPLSAESEAGLSALASSYIRLLEASSAPSLADVVYSASVRRSHLSKRVAVIGHDRNDIINKLRTFVSAGHGEDIYVGGEPVAGADRTAFVYTGMGPQWWAMGQELFGSNKAYREAAETIDAAFYKVSGFSILAEMLQKEATSRLSETQIAQPANFLLQVALTKALDAVGIRPAAVVGHSVGEVSAAYVAGVLSLEDAMLVCFHRSRLQKTAAGTGSMLAVGLSDIALRPLLEEHTDSISIAAINGPSSVTLAGDTTVLAELSNLLTADNVFNRHLQVEVPYHSPMMDPLRDELLISLADVRPTRPQIPLYSSVTGERVDGIAYDAPYWFRNVREPVLFAKAVRAMLNDGLRAFLEVGPHPVLSSSLNECFNEAKQQAKAIETLRRNRPEMQSVTAAPAKLYTAGCDVDWRVRYPHGRFVALPNYPWQRQKLWKEAEVTRLDRLRAPAPTLLGHRVASPSPTWEMEFSEAVLPYLSEHKIQELTVAPGAAYLEMLLQLHQEMIGGDTAVIRGVRFSQALILGEAHSTRLATVFNTEKRTAAIVTRNANSDVDWTTHAEASLYHYDAGTVRSQDLASIRLRINNAIDVAELYEALHRRGLQYGPKFRTITSLFKGKQEVLAHIKAAPGMDNETIRYQVHPTLLDGCFQALIATVDEAGNGGFVPVSLKELKIYGAFPDELWCHGRMIASSVRQLEFDFEVYAQDGALVAEAKGLRCQALPGDARQSPEALLAKRTYQYCWFEQNGSNGKQQPGRWLVFSDEGTIGETLSKEMQKAGVAELIMAGPTSRLLEADGRMTLIQSMPQAGASARHTKPMNLHRSVESIDGVVFLSGCDADPESSDPVGLAAAERILSLLQSLATITPALPRIYVVTRAAHHVVDADASVNPAQGTMLGLTRVAFNELGDMHCTSIDLSAVPTSDEVRMLANELVSNFNDEEVALRGQSRFVSKLQLSEALTTPSLGQLDTSRKQAFVLSNVAKSGAPVFREMDRISPRAGEIVVEVHAVSGSHRFLKAHAVEAASGSELTAFVSGVVADLGDGVTDFAIGDRICGYVRTRLASQVALNARSAIRVKSVPEPTVEVASSVALQARALCLVDHAKVDTESTVLVYADLAGLAFIQAAKARGAVVIAFGSVEFGNDVAEQFGADHVVWNSEDMHDVVHHVTRGDGVDVLAVPIGVWAKSRDFSILAAHSYLVNTADAPLDFRIPLDEHVGAVVSVTTDALFDGPRNPLIGYASHALDALTAGVFRPIPQPTLLAEELLLAQEPQSASKSFTVILTNPGHGTPLPIEPLEVLPINATGTYVISGGFGGFGSAVARWLVQQGARNLALLGRRGLADPNASAFVHELQERGVSVVAPPCDVADPEQLRAAFAVIAATLPPVRGVIHSAAVLADAPLHRLTSQEFRRAMLPKALGAWNLHNATAGCPLEFFVLFSSISALVGNSGQTNYVAANCYLDALAWHRRAAELPATTINWGAIADVGIVTRDATLQKHLEYTGLSAIPVADALYAFGKILARRPTQLCVAAADWQQWARYEAKGGQSDKFAGLIGETIDNDQAAKNVELRNKLLSVAPQDRHELLAYILAEIFGTELKMAVEEVDVRRPFNRMGVDSLMAVELQLSIESVLGARISALELVGDLTIWEIASRCLEQLDIPTIAVAVAA
jgi:acyl transferase domain-containing protein/NAD(P)-dependent dehydrogenase (short-subunit alcohol dehydrogenase family)/acyl carrier protein